MTMGKNPGVATKHNDRLQRRTVYTIFPGDTPEVQIWTAYVKAFESHRPTDIHDQN